MLRNYLLIAYRNLLRQKLYNSFNLIGLSLGIACGLLLTLHIKEELSYEKSFSKYDRIYRVVTPTWSKSSPVLALEMPGYFSEIESVARFSSAGKRVVNSDFDKQGESSGYFADSSVIKMFDLKTVAGDPIKALSEPNAIVITRSMSEKYFRDEDPIGKRLIFDNRDEAWVKGVIEDLPKNTHLNFDYLSSIATMYKFMPDKWMNHRGWMFGWTYVLFKDRNGVQKASARMEDFMLHFYGIPEENQAELIAENLLIFQAVRDIYLGSNLIQEMGPNSSILYIYIFIAVEILILLIASINFINLFSTQALKRMKEVGIRKILGAGKRHIIQQFLGEAFILSFLATLIAITIYQVSLPVYNNISGNQISAWEILEPDNLLVAVGLILFVGLIAGLYPALFIAEFKPVNALGSAKAPRSLAQYVRKGLVVFQFIISAFLIISTIFINQQMKLFREKDLGFDKEQVVALKLYGNLKENIISNPEIIKEKFLSNPDIMAVGAVSNLIGEDLSVESLVPVNQEAGRDYPSVKLARIDENYIDVLNIQIKEGRNFSREFNDSASFIVNETAVQMLGLDSPIGTMVTNQTRGLTGPIVGIIKDFHFSSLHQSIAPLVLEYNPWSTDNLLVKIAPGKIPETLSFLHQKFDDIAPNVFFNYIFLDEKIEGLYRKEGNMSDLLKTFSALAIIISCLGLFGLSAHAAQIRTKEIGIRKVVGADIPNVLRLLTKDFIMLVLLGNLLAWPIAWYAIDQWLQNFSYKIDIGISVFILSSIITLLIAMVTISYHCIRTATENPIKSLRYE